MENAPSAIEAHPGVQETTHLVKSPHPVHALGPTTIGFEVPIEGIDTENFAFVWLPEEGVGPFYPALIEFP